MRKKHKLALLLFKHGDTYMNCPGCELCDGIKKVAGEQVPMEDIVGMAGIVNELKNDSNAGSREAALASLSYVKAPEYKDDLKMLFAEASKDIDPKVKARAEKELAELDK